MPQANWNGASGTVYQFEVLTFEGEWNAVAGVYIFAKDVGYRGWTPLYIGQTDNFKERFRNHEKLPCATKAGMTHVHVFRNVNEDARLRAEADLIKRYSPPCNVQGT